MRHVNITIYGRVQGVGFRWSSQKQAEKLCITGFVQNLPNHALYIEAEGDESQMIKFLAWCSKGPVWAKVDRIETTGGEMQRFPKFIIL